MDGEAQRLRALPVGQGGVVDPRRVVGDRADDAARVGGAVARHVDPAGVGRGVVRVDVVPRRGVAEDGHVCDLVGEEGRFAYVLVVEEVGGVFVCEGCEVEGCQVGDCSMA